MSSTGVAKMKTDHVTDEEDEDGHRVQRFQTLCLE